jgi:tetratricopeptide (TPR) repeat protein
MKKLILLLIAVATTQTTTAQTAQQWRDSLTVLNRMIDREPRSTDLRLRKAAVNIQLGQWDYAIDEYGKVLMIEHDNPAALYYRAYCLTNQRQYAMARSDYEAFLRKMPTHMEALLGLATVYARMGRVTDARDQYNQMVEMFRDSVVCYVARAVFETSQQQYDVALYDWDEAISRQPQNVDYVASKVDLLLKLERRKEALEELEKALQRGVPRGVLKEWIDKCQKSTR